MNYSLLYLCPNDIKEGTAIYTHVTEIVKGLKKRNWNVSLYKIKYKKKNPSIIDRLFEIIRVQLKIVKRILGADIIYIRMGFSTFPTAFLGRIFNVPVVQEVNGTYDDLFIVHPISEKIASIIKWLIKKQIKWASRVIAVTDELKNWAINKVGQKRISVIPNGANTELFKPEYIKPLDLPEKYAIFFGALNKWQGIETLMESIKHPEWPNDLFLVIVGDGQEKYHIIKMSKSNKQIIYLGKLAYRKVPKIICNSIMSIIPVNNYRNRSIKGLSPLKLYESLASGVPVIVTDFPGQADFVKKYECGIVIPHENPEELVKSVLYLYKNEHKRKEMGSRGRNAVKDYHSWDIRAKQTSDILLNVLK